MWAIEWSRDRWRQVTLKGQTRDSNSLKAQYFENYLSYRLQIWYAALYGECRAGAQKISPKSGRGLGHVTLQFLAVRSAILATAWLLVFKFLHRTFQVRWARWGLVAQWLTLWLSGREVRGLHPGHATILLGSNLGQVVYSHCLPSLLSSKKLAVQSEYSDRIDLTA